MACEILVPPPGIESVPPAVEARSLNHWTTREIPRNELILIAVYVHTISSLLHCELTEGRGHVSLTFASLDSTL